MADDNDKTEAPTARRRTEARSRGQIPKSQDLTAAILLLVGLLTLNLFGGWMWASVSDMTTAMLGGTRPTLVGSDLIPLGSAAVREMFSLLVPILLVFMLTALVVVLLQTGFLFTTEPLKWSLEKLNPIAGFKKLFSPETLMKLLISLGKMGVVGGVAYVSVIGQMDKIMFASGLAFLDLVHMAIELFYGLGIRVALVLVLLGLIDWIYQRFKHERSLRMSKQEIKEEMRSMDGDPLMKRRRREVQLQLAMQRLQRDVPQADVVVTNPTHIAVALKYDSDTMGAPRMIAKGKDHVALRIREIALAAGIPIVERKPLARVLYKLVEVGQEIPADLYKTVAEVLAYVYELSGKRQKLAAASGATR